MILFAATTFLSSILLFFVQPLIARMILPWFGGAAAVWITCLVFFQVVLLLGYFYAHLLVSRHSPARQRLVHASLLLCALWLLPLAPTLAGRMPDAGTPVPDILRVLFGSVALPFFLLSSTSPLLQSWYAKEKGSRLPYRLYALSNLASLAGLVSYPFLIEPYFSLSAQSRFWSAGFALFVLSCLAAGYLGGRGTYCADPREPGPSGDGAEIPSPAVSDRILWLLLSGCASILLLAVTNHLTQNVSSVPFLWILPLGLYLVTLSLAFDRPLWYPRRIYLLAGLAAVGVMSYGLHYWVSNAKLWVLVPAYGGGLFVCCMICHGELARSKPAAGHLTSFYLQLALGGALGGILVGLAAPTFLSGFYELPLGLLLFAGILFLVHRGKRILLDLFLGAAWIAVLAATVGHIRAHRLDTIHQVRNFYGTLRVYVEFKGTSLEYRKLVNGEINHGEQFVAADRRRLPLTYYSETSGVGRAIRWLQKRGAMQTAVIGLGVGTLASYQRPGDELTFFDINPAVEPIARKYFSYLADSPGRIGIVEGDGRLSLQQMAGRTFDLIAVDAFSSDAIPVHLLTRQAVDLYFQRLKPHGLLALHISNKHLNLQPVVAAICRASKKSCLLVDDAEETDRMENFGTDWAIAARDMSFAESTEFRDVSEPLEFRSTIEPWTDDFNNLITILKRD